MSRNGSGIYSLATGNPVTTGTTISSTWANGTLTDIASALTTSIASDGQTVISANIPMNSKKLTGLAAPTVAGDALSFGAVATISTLTTTADASIHGLNVGLGASSVASNTAIGTSALSSNTSGGSNLAVGYTTLSGNTTGIQNVAVGASVATLNTTGSYNTAMGGSNNVSTFAALRSNLTGDFNTAIGNSALQANTASYNTAIGGYALQSNTTGTNNVALGYQTLNANTTAYNNTAVGYQALYGITIPSNNVALGFTAGSKLTTGYFGVYIGSTTQASSSSAIGEIVIGGSGITGKGTNTGFISPNSGGVYQGNNSAAWSITSDQRLKKNIVDNTTGLSVINAIQVRNFEYRTAEEVTELEAHSAIDIKGVQLGAIAQELQLILPECVKTESTGVMSVDATNLTWYLINAVKELSAQVTTLQTQVTALTPVVPVTVA